MTTTFNPGHRVRCPGRVQRSHGSEPCRASIFPPAIATVITLRLLEDGWPEPGEIPYVCPRCNAAYAISAEPASKVA